nr:class I SAM-dependent methyltransferase [Mycolicibacterium komanii]CRL73965.1 type 11 methyltransferase [Mycolicibacterium komanii]
MADKPAEITAGRPATSNIDRMPRGGPDASCLDRLLQSDRETDASTDVARKRGVTRALELTGGWFGSTERFAEIALAEVEDVADPRILELGAGSGELSRMLLDWHPSARLTVTDADKAAVAAIAASDLGEHRRATVSVMDPTAIDAADGSFDLAVFALAFHHLPPAAAARAIAEGTRVAGKLLIIDLKRPPAPLHVVRLATVLPFARLWPFVRDGVASSLRCYSPAALRALAEHADPAIEVELRGGLLSPQVVVAQRGAPDPLRTNGQR